jgi:hypothetical protein
MQEPANLHVAIHFFQKLWQAHEVVIMTPHYITLLISSTTQTNNRLLACNLSICTSTKAIVCKNYARTHVPLPGAYQNQLGMEHHCVP